VGSLPGIKERSSVMATATFCYSILPVAFLANTVYDAAAKPEKELPG